MAQHVIEIWANATRFADRERALWGGGGSAQRAAHLVYQAMDRHISRHVVTQANRRLVSLIRLHDPQEIARQIAASPQDRMAWAFLLWLFTVEPLIVRRRWCEWPGFPERKHRTRGAQPVNLNEALLAHSLPVRIDPEAKSMGQGRWLQLHASGAILQGLWSRAVEAAQDMARNGIATWGIDVLGGKLPPGQFHGRVLADGSASFTRQAGMAIGPLPAAPRSDKVSRRAAYELRSAARASQIREACRGPCLQFSWEEGWRVVDSRLPDIKAMGSDVRRHRLVEQGRPTFFLIQTENGYAARMRSPALQVQDTSPWKTIELLRQAYRRHLKEFPRAKGTSKRGPDAGSSVDSARVDLGGATRDVSSFWRNGPMLARSLAMRSAAPCTMGADVRKSEERSW